MKFLLVLLSLTFFGLAGFIVTGTLQEFITFQGVANEIATFLIAVLGGGICLAAAARTPERGTSTVPVEQRLPRASHHRDIEIDADRWEEEQEILKELAGK